METLDNFKDWSGSSVPASLYAIGRFTLVYSPHWIQEKIRENLHVTGGFRYDILGPQAGSWKCFHGQNRLWSLWRGLPYCKDFKNL